MKTPKLPRAVEARLPRPARAIPVVALSMDDAATALNVSKPTIYGLIEAGVLRTFCVGKRRLTSPDALAAAIRALEEVEANRLAQVRESLSAANSLA